MKGFLDKINLCPKMGQSVMDHIRTCERCQQGIEKFLSTMPFGVEMLIGDEAMKTIKEEVEKWHKPL